MVRRELTISIISKAEAVHMPTPFQIRKAASKIIQSGGTEKNVILSCIQQKKKKKMKEKISKRNNNLYISKWNEQQFLCDVSPVGSCLNSSQRNEFSAKWRLPNGNNTPKKKKRETRAKQSAKTQCGLVHDKTHAHQPQISRLSPSSPACAKFMKFGTSDGSVAQLRHLISVISEIYLHYSWSYPYDFHHHTY